MVIRIPENPRLVNGSEESVWNALLGQLGDGDLVVANQRVTDNVGPLCWRSMRRWCRSVRACGCTSVCRGHGGQLAVCGDPDFIREVGGAELTKRMGI